jgi:hypothetical protein
LPSAEKVAKTAALTISVAFSVCSCASVVRVIDVKLPTEVRNFTRRSCDIDVVPPTGWRSSNTLTLLCIMKKVGQLEASIMSRMVATNKDTLVLNLIVFHVTEDLCNTSQEVAL